MCRSTICAAKSRCTSTVRSRSTSCFLLLNHCVIKGHSLGSIELPSSSPLRPGIASSYFSERSYLRSVNAECNCRTSRPIDGPYVIRTAPPELLVTDIPTIRRFVVSIDRFVRRYQNRAITCSASTRTNATRRRLLPLPRHHRHRRARRRRKCRQRRLVDCLGVLSLLQKQLRMHDRCVIVRLRSLA